MKSQKKKTLVKKPKQHQRPKMVDKDIVILGGSGTDSITVTDTVTLDLDLGAAQPALSTFSLDSLTLDDMSSTSTITLPSTNYTISSVGGGGTGNIYNSIGSGNGYVYSNSYSPTVNIDSDGVNIKDGGDLKVGGKSLKDFMTKVEDRLAILVPDPKKLEKFEALKKAYEHYKTMERLCQIEEEDDNK